MGNPKQPTPQGVEVYHALEEALMQSAQGRWFLAEFARRNRNSDTQTVLEAIGRLETAVQQPRTSADLIRRDLIEMSEAISRTRAEIASIKPPRGGADGGAAGATEELDAIVTATEQATSDILAATEAIQETLWRLREQEHKPLQAICDALESQLTDIITACSFQDITGQRITKVVQVIRLVEARVNSMIEIWGLDDYEIEAVPAAFPDDSESRLLSGPQGEGLKQSDVDSMIEDLDAYDAVEAGEMVVAAADMPVSRSPDSVHDEDDLFGPNPDYVDDEGEPEVGRQEAIQRAAPARNGADLLSELTFEALDPVKRDALFT